MSFSYAYVKPLTCRPTELPSCNTLPQRGYRDPDLGPLSVVPDDLCWILCSPDIHSTSTAVVAMVMPSEGKILPLAIAHAYLQPSTTQYTLEALSVNEVGSGLMIVDELQGVPINISASLIMQTVRVFTPNDFCCVIAHHLLALWLRPEQLLQRCAGSVCIHCWL